MQKFKVLRQHIGDQFYDPTGMTGPAERVADPREVAHLVESGVLEAPENKALSAVPETKAEKKAREKAEADQLAQAEADRKAAEEAEAARVAQEEAERKAAEEAEAAQSAAEAK